MSILRPFLVCCLAFAAWALEAGQPAPAISLPTAAGATWTLAGQTGKWVVLEWVNFDCPFVKKHYRAGAMQRLQREWSARGVVWASVCSSAPGKQGHFAGAALTARFAEEKSAAAAYLVDESGAVGKDYDARTTPQIVVVDPKGMVAYWGAVDSIASTDPADIPRASNHVDAVLAAALDGKAPPLAASKPYGCSVKY